MDDGTSSGSEGNRIYAKFGVYNLTTDPSRVTDLLGVSPTSLHRQGDRVGRLGTLHYKAGVWRLASPRGAYQRLEECVEYVLSRLPPDLAPLRKLPDSWTATMSCAIDLYDVSPDFSLAASTVARLAALPVALDWDIYVLGARRRTLLSPGSDMAGAGVESPGPRSGVSSPGPDQSLEDQGPQDDWPEEDTPPSTCQVALQIEGDTIDLERVTELLGLQPTEVRQRGDGRRGTAAAACTNTWIYRRSDTRYIEWSEALDELLEALPPTLGVLDGLNMPWRAVVMCTAWISGAGGPALVLEKEHLSRLAALPAAIDLELWEADADIAPRR